MEEVAWGVDGKGKEGERGRLVRWERGYRGGKEKKDRGYEAESIFIGREASRRRKKKVG